jgi:hypothetical protein
VLGTTDGAGEQAVPGHEIAVAVQQQERGGSRGVQRAVEVRIGQPGIG